MVCLCIVLKTLYHPSAASATSHDVMSYGQPAVLRMLICLNPRVVKMYVVVTVCCMACLSNVISMVLGFGNRGILAILKLSYHVACTNIFKGIGCNVNFIPLSLYGFCAFENVGNC